MSPSRAGWDYRQDKREALRLLVLSGVVRSSDTEVRYYRVGLTGSRVAPASGKPESLRNSVARLIINLDVANLLDRYLGERKLQREKSASTSHGPASG